MGVHISNRVTIPRQATAFVTYFQQLVTAVRFVDSLMDPGLDPVMRSSASLDQAHLPETGGFACLVGYRLAT